MALIENQSVETKLGERPTAVKLRNVEDIYPLSPLQQGILFHCVAEHDPGMYLVQHSYFVNGELDACSLRRAWEEVLKRHAALRTGFVWEGLGEPLQVVRQTVDLLWSEDDWSGLEKAEREEEWHRWVQQDRQRGFDFKRAPLMRVALFRFGPSSYRMVWSQHHLVLDGWSIAIVLNELVKFYDAFSSGKSLDLRPPRSFRDYIQWLRSKDRNTAEEFWEELLRGLKESTRFGAGLSSGASDGGSGKFDRRSLKLSREMTKATAGLAAKCHVTLNCVVQGAWALLLARYAGSSDVVFGAVTAGRPPELSGSEAMVGMFINTLPVRLRMNPAATVAGFLQALQGQQIEAQRFAHCSLTDIQNWSRVPRTQPLFETIFAFENYATQLVSRSGQSAIRVQRAETEDNSNYALSAIANPGEQLALQVLYRCDRFDSRTVERILAHWQVLLEQITADPTRPLASVNMLSMREEYQLMHEWNHEETEFASENCIHELVEAQARKRPDAVAVVFQDSSLSYKDLNRQANRLAHCLRKLGITADSCVALCMERSPEMIVAMLAVLKAGGAYVPLDPAAPAERLQLMLEDSTPRALITQLHLRAFFTGVENLVPIIDASCAAFACMEDDDEQADHGPVFGGPFPEGLAYVMYTSGSTGTPKGVMITHRNIVRLVSNTNYLDFRPELTIGQVSNAAFDASTFEIWGALANGCRLAIIPKYDVLAPQSFSRQLMEQQVSTLFLTTALFHECIRSMPEALQHLRQLFFGGENCDRECVQNAMDSSRHLVHVYGPTETTTFATYHVIQSLEPGMAVPIGKPLTNTRVYILDANGGLAAQGVTGELYIGGPGVGRGYLKQPELTASRFLPDTFAGHPGARMYKTGDLGRWTSHGSIEFLGRDDFQVKIRGFRVELGEIETALLRHPEVQQAVVLAREDAPGQKRLVGYVVQQWAAEGPELVVSDRLPFNSAQLKSHLRSLLPEYMVPDTILILDRIPLTGSGKIDRRALPDPGMTQIQISAPLHDPVEQALAETWKEVLNVAFVDRKQSFFELGGNSLLALRLSTKLKERFGLEIPVSLVFERPTVELLAPHVARVFRDGVRGVSRSNLVPIHPTGKRRPFFCVHPGGGGTLAYVQLARMLGEDQPFYGLQALTDIENQCDEILSMQDRAAQYIDALQQVQPHGPYLLGGWSYGAYVAYEMAQQLWRQGEVVSGLMLLDIGTEPMLPEEDGDEAEQLMQLATELLAGPGLSLDGVAGRSPDERLHYLVRQMIKIGALPEVDIAQVRDHLKGLRMRHRSLASYRLESYPGTITLIRCTDGQTLPLKPSVDPRDPTLGFACLSPNPVQVHFVPGANHHNLLFSPHVQKLADVLQKCLHHT